jgi:peptidoglycan/xylan/chitin deacetylase (PgdA/CDA1 family)
MRLFLSVLTIVVLTLVLQDPPKQVLANLEEAKDRKEIAVTFDDLPLNGRQFEAERLKAMTTKIVASIKKHNIPAVGFVNESQLYRFGEIDQRIAILKIWSDSGLELGNHTFSHMSLNVTPLETYKEDTVRGETITQMLLAPSGKKIRYFRHPYLRTGATVDIKDDFEKFLWQRGYTVAPVTIENSDWMYNLVYTTAKTRGDSETMKEATKQYLNHTEAMFDFFEKLSVELTGYQIKHIFLLHSNELNADNLDFVVDLIKRRGYNFIPLEEALKDKVYTLPNTYAGKAGPSWIHRWMHTKGMEMKLKQEPEPSEMIQKMYEKEL